MRLVEAITEWSPGKSASGRRVAQPEDWYFQGHFPDEPVVPAIVLVELLAQTGGVAAALDEDRLNTPVLRIAAIGPFKFPAGARPHQVLEARAEVTGRFAGVVRIEGEVLADGKRVAIGSVTLAEIRRPDVMDRADRRGSVV
jgi:3-hydroxyacyl-[acyl-carrier-protein] dehydratase